MNKFLDCIFEEIVDFLKEHCFYETYDSALYDQRGIRVGKTSEFYSLINDDMFTTTINWNQASDHTGVNYDRFHEIYKEFLELWPSIVHKCADKLIGCNLDVYKTSDTDYYISVVCYYNTSVFTIKVAQNTYFCTECNAKFLYSVYKKLSLEELDRIAKEVNESNFIFASEMFLSIFDCFCSKLTPYLMQVSDKSEFPYRYFDIKPDGKITYLPYDKCDRVTDDKYTTTLRRTTSIGKILNKFNKLVDKNHRLSPCDIEEISNSFASAFCKCKMEIWDSKYIKNAYLEDNYSKISICGESSLYSSCMRYASSQPYLDFYELAGAKIAVLLDVNSRIIGRALIWKIKGDLYFVDRIYTLSDIYIKLFIDNLRKLIDFDYYRRGANLFDRDDRRVDYDKISNYTIQSDKLIGYSGLYPYVDTFWVFNSNSGSLFVGGSDTIKVLHRTDGKYENI